MKISECELSKSLLIRNLFNRVRVLEGERSGKNKKPSKLNKCDLQKLLELHFGGDRINIGNSSGDIITSENLRWCSTRDINPDTIVKGNTTLRDLTNINTEANHRVKGSNLTLKSALSEIFQLSL